MTTGAGATSAAGTAGEVRTIGVALAVPEPWADRLRRARASYGDPLADLVPPHVTLLPPTEVALADLPSISDHLAAVATAEPPFTLRLRSTGTFRPVSPVVFVAVAVGAERCSRLESAVRSGPLRRELRFDYHPHVTVAQAVPDPELDRAQTELVGFEAGFTVDALHLYECDPDGVWRPTRSFPLAGARG